MFKVNNKDTRNLHDNRINLMSVLNFPKQLVADYKCVLNFIKLYNLK